MVLYSQLTGERVNATNLHAFILTSFPDHVGYDMGTRLI